MFDPVADRSDWLREKFGTARIKYMAGFDPFQLDLGMSDGSEEVADHPTLDGPHRGDHRVEEGVAQADEE